MQKIQYLIATALCVGALAASTTGCELIASVDRSKIKGEGGNGGGGGGGTGGHGGSSTCTNKMKDGDETDVDCGGSCPKCEQAKGCKAAADCTSGFCATGVCCDKACDGTCQACTAALKVSGDDGTCGQAKEGAACGDMQACKDGQETVGDTCDAAGACKDGGTKMCGAYACDTTGKACLTMCTTNMDCAACHTCSMGACVPSAAGTTGAGCMGNQACDGAGSCKAANGQACTMATDCATGHCVDGVCCDTACSGNCQACNLTGKVGTCSNEPRGTTEPLCTAPANVCDDMGACKKGAGATCTTGAECASGTCSSIGICTTPMP